MGDPTATPPIHRVKRYALGLFAIISLILTLRSTVHFLLFLKDGMMDVSTRVKILFFSSVIMDLLVHTVGLVGALRRQMEATKVYTILLAFFAVIFAIKLSLGVTNLWTYLVWYLLGLAIGALYYRELAAIENQYEEQV